jgi:general secretion pathway protein G
MQQAFTLLEIVFVIIIISIVTIIAIPKFTSNIEFTTKVQIKSDVALIRSSIKEYANKETLLGKQLTYPSSLDTIINNLNSSNVWEKQETYIYIASIDNNKKVEFKYDNSNGLFDCIHKEQEYCQDINR